MVMIFGIGLLMDVVTGTPCGEGMWCIGQECVNRAQNITMSPVCNITAECPTGTRACETGSANL